jgi:hypothetical protein
LVLAGQDVEQQPMLRRARAGQSASGLRDVRPYRVDRYVQPFRNGREAEPFGQELAHGELARCQVRHRSRVARDAGRRRACRPSRPFGPNTSIAA